MMLQEIHNYTKIENLFTKKQKFHDMDMTCLRGFFKFFTFVAESSAEKVTNFLLFCGAQGIILKAYVF